MSVCSILCSKIRDTSCVCRSCCFATQYAVRGELFLKAGELQKAGKEIIFTNGAHNHLHRHPDLMLARMWSDIDRPVNWCCGLCGCLPSFSRHSHVQKHAPTSVTCSNMHPNLLWNSFKPEQQIGLLGPGCCVQLVLRSCSWQPTPVGSQASHFHTPGEASPHALPLLHKTRAAHQSSTRVTKRVMIGSHGQLASMLRITITSAATYASHGTATVILSHLLSLFVCPGDCSDSSPVPARPPQGLRDLCP